MLARVPLCLTNTMKFHSSVVASAAFLCSSSPGLFQTEAWVSKTGLHQCRFNKKSSVFHSTSLKSTTTREDNISTAIKNSGNGSEEGVIAEGTIVSFFRGGLAAVRTFGDVASGSEMKSTQAGLSAPTASAGEASSSIGGDLLGHEVMFSDGSRGVIVAHRPPVAFVYSDIEKMDGQDGAVTILDKLKSVSVPNFKSEPVVSWQGATSSVDNDDSPKRTMFAPIPKVSEIALINNPMLTGITMFDALSPIGRGQNMLVVGQDLDDVRGYVCDLIKTQVKQDTKIVYAATEKSDEALARLRMEGALDDIQVVAAKVEKTGDEDDSNVVVTQAADAISVAATACAIGESYALEEGKHSLVIIDTIDQHKQLWDATTRVLVDVFGVDAVVQGDRDGGASSEMRAFYSSLIQRAGQFNQKKGGGSVTLLLLTTVPTANAESEESLEFKESDFEDSPLKVKERIQLLVKRGVKLSAENLRKIDIPIPSVSEGKRRLVLQHIDDLISMTDGQIWLDEALQQKGQRPPMDPQRSITRVGIGADTESQADAPALRRLIQGLRLEISQSADMDGAEATNASKKQLRNRNAILLAMHQEPGQGGRKLSQSCTLLLAVTKGFFNEVIDEGALAGTEKGAQIVQDLLEHVSKVASDAMTSIDETLNLSSETEEEIINAISSFFES